MQNSPIAPRMVCRTFSMQCKTFDLLCKSLVLLCKTLIELSKTFLPLCKSLHCYVRSPKLPLVCLFAYWSDNLGEQEVRDDYFSMCGRSHTLQDIQISRYILMFELPNPPSLNVGWHEWPHKSSWTHLKSISEQRSKDSYPPFHFFRAALIIRLWRTDNKNLPNWIMPMSDEQGNDLLSRTKSQQKLVHLDLSKWQTTAKNNWSRFADERSLLLISFSFCLLLRFLAFFLLFRFSLAPLSLWFYWNLATKCPVDRKANRAWTMFEQLSVIADLSEISHGSSSNCGGSFGPRK